MHFILHQAGLAGMGRQDTDCSAHAGHGAALQLLVNLQLRAHGMRMQDVDCSAHAGTAQPLLLLLEAYCRGVHACCRCRSC